MMARVFLVVALILASLPALRTARAVEPIAAIKPVLDYVPAEAFAAVLAHPQRIASRPEARWLPLEVFTAAGMKEFGFDPLKIDEALLLAPWPSGGPPDVGLVLRFSRPYAAGGMTLDRVAGERVEFQGQTYVRTGGGAPCTYLPDDRTIVFATEPMLQKMLAARGADSGLIKLLRAADKSVDVLGLVSVDDVRGPLTQLMAAAPPLPPNLADVTKLPDLLSNIEIRLSLVPGANQQFIFDTRDEAAADRLEQLLLQALEMGKQIAAQQVTAKIGNDNSDPVQRALQQYFNRLADEIATLFRPVRQGNTVTITVQSELDMARLGILSGLLLPAIQKSRDSARRAVSMNNLRQIGLAMISYESDQGKLPAQASYDAAGRPLLSWRVHVLPYLEQQTLYSQFHLDEPWDSEHNKPLADKMPPIYASPRYPSETETLYVLPTGKGLVFDGSNGRTLASISDGTSNTILAVEANPGAAVIWTKPEDLKFDADNPWKGLADDRAASVSVLMADGSVQAIPRSLDGAKLRGLLTPDGGEAVSLDP
jgi:type II secretory pathway pseudopilin PulG